MKSFLSLLATAIVLQTAAAQTDLESGLVLYLPFTETISNTSEVEVFGDPVLVADRFGNFDEALELDGNGDYLRIAHEVSLSFPEGQPFTIAFWFRADSIQADRSGSVNTLISKWYGDPNPGENGLVSNYDIRLRNDQHPLLPGTIYSTIYDGDACGSERQVVTEVSTGYLDNGWHHLLLEQSEDGILKLYIDCELRDNDISPLACNFANVAPIFIGRRGDANFPRSFSGAFDEIRMYNRILSDDERKAVFDINTNLDEVGVIGNAGFRVTPNPITTDHFYLQLSEELIQTGIEHILFFDAAGRSQPLTWQPDQGGIRFTLSNSSLPDGVYFVKAIFADGRQGAAQLVLQRK